MRTRDDGGQGWAKGWMPQRKHTINYFFLLVFKNHVVACFLGVTLFLHQAGVVEWSTAALARFMDCPAVQSALLLVVNRLCLKNPDVKAWKAGRYVKVLGLCDIWLSTRLWGSRF